MFISPSLGLTIWDSGLDYYDTTQLANNWAIIDQHDHTPSKGHQITTNAIVDGSITAGKIAPGVIPDISSFNFTVTQANIANGAVGTAQIVNASVGVNQLAALPAAKINTTTSASQSNSYATVALNTLVYDNNSIAVLGSHELVVQTAGLYLVVGEILVNVSGSTTFWANVLANGSSLASSNQSTGGVQVPVLYRAAVNDILTLQAKGGLTTLTYGALSASFISP